MLLVRAGHQLIHIDTDEEERASALLSYLADQLNLPLFTWSRIRGLSRIDLPGAVYDTENPSKAFRHIASSQMAALYHFKDLGPHLGEDPILAAQMREAAEALGEAGGSVLVTGSGLAFPDAVEQMVTPFVLPGPSDQEYRELITQIVRDMRSRRVEMDMSKEDLTLLLRHMS